MKKKILLLSMLLVMAALSYSATKPSLEASLNSIENKFNDLLEKEAQKNLAHYKHIYSSSKMNILYKAFGFARSSSIIYTNSFNGVFAYHCL